jgi:ribosome-binding factor A
MMKKPRLKEPSQRMLKVGEEVRHALAEIFMRGELHAPELDGVSVTVSEVRMTPDLKRGIAYIALLEKNDRLEPVITGLNRHYDGALKRALAPKLHLKFLPTIRFKADTSFDEADKIYRLLHGVSARDASMTSEPSE